MEEMKSPDGGETQSVDCVRVRATSASEQLNDKIDF
jgi:hypothetical protein